jgi:transcriptional regulator with XRE-family HTH domain
VGISVRELARRLAVSASLISQIERGKASPSVGTLYAITTELELSLDELFAVADAPGGGRAPTPQIASDPGPVVHADDRESISLASGVVWERLTPTANDDIEFLHVIYKPGGASCEAGVLMRHAGHERGHVLSGRLSVTIGFDEHLLAPGDSISFSSSQPHRLAAVGDTAAHAIWVVHGRNGSA